MRIALPIAYFQTILLNVVCRVESAQGDKIISAHRQEPDERSMATQTSPWGSMGSEGGLKHWVRRWLPYNCRSFFGVSASSCLISVRLILDHFWLWLIVNDKLVAARSFFIPTLSVLASLGSTLVAIGVWCMICQYVQSNFARTSCQSIFLASHCHCSIWFLLFAWLSCLGGFPTPEVSNIISNPGLDDVVPQCPHFKPPLKDRWSARSVRSFSRSEQMQKSRAARRWDRMKAFSKLQLVFWCSRFSRGI